MPRLFAFAAAPIAALWLLVSGSAAAFVPLEPSYFQESLQGQTSGNPTRFGNGLDDLQAEAIGLEESGTYGAYRVNAWTAGWNLGSAYAHAEASGTGNYPGSFGPWAGDGAASASISYQFVEEVSPPCATPPCEPVRVPVFIHGNGSVAVAASGGIPGPFDPPGYYAGANSTLYFMAGGSSWATLGKACIVSTNPADPLCSSASFDVNETFDLVVDRLNYINLYVFAYADTGNRDPGWGIAEAWIDPIIQIDPGFALRDHYRLVFSAGITADPPPNGGPVPEPVTLLLVVAGLACTPVLRRARTRRR
jgi:hypothetical protein